MKYKKGDKVEVVEFISSVASEHGANIGDIGVVDIASDTGDGVPYFVKLDAVKTGDNGLWFREDGIKLVEEEKIETGDIVSIISLENTAATYGWNENMKQIGESMKVDSVYGVTVENDIFVYHIDDLVLLRKGDSDVVEPHIENQDKPVDDVVNKPKHYTSDESGVECIDITKNMSFVYGNVLKYCWRVGKKDDDVQELSKALWYSEFGINNNIPIFINETSLEDEKNIQKVLKFSKGWKYVLLNAIYWNDKEEVNRAVKGLLEDIND